MHISKTILAVAMACASSYAFAQDASSTQAPAEELLPRASLSPTSTPVDDTTNQLHWGGFITFGYENEENANSSFSTSFTPLILWKIDERLFMDAELEFELHDGKTEVNLGFAEANYLINDNLTATVGKIIVPFGSFVQHLHPSWINRLPDNPLLAGHGGLVPMGEIGAKLQGVGYLTDTIKGNFALYVTNGPSLVNGDHEAGTLAFGLTDDNNNNKAFGGRFAIQPIPSMEIGASFMTGKATDAGEEPATIPDTDFFLWGVDASYMLTSDAIKGTLRLNAEVINTSVDAITGLVDDGNPAELDGSDNNQRNAWYIQSAYWPMQAQSFIKDYEVVVRYDSIDVADVLDEDQERLTVGINRWLNTATVIKLAYRMDIRDDDADEADALLFQYSMAF